MALPSSGQITMSQVNAELGRPANLSASLNESVIRTLAGRSSGQIGMSDLRGKSAAAPFNPKSSVTFSRPSSGFSSYVSGDSLFGSSTFDSVLLIVFHGGSNQAGRFSKAQVGGIIYPTTYNYTPASGKQAAIGSWEIRINATTYNYLAGLTAPWGMGFE